MRKLMREEIEAMNFLILKKNAALQSTIKRTLVESAILRDREGYGLLRGTCRERFAIPQQLVFFEGFSD
jgi:hypothetical protein